MGLYMRAECLDYLQASLMETITRLLESKQSAELNPNKMDSPDEACSNAEYLLQTLDQVFQNLLIHTYRIVRRPIIICRFEHVSFFCR